MDISQYLRIANTANIDANARIDLNGEGTVSAVGTSKVGRLGERIVRSAADSQHYTQVRQSFLNSLKTLYGVDDQLKLPKMVLDAFKDEEVVCGKPLTKRRITAVLDAVRRNLNYTSLDALADGVAEHVKAFGDKVQLTKEIDLGNDEADQSFFDDSDSESEVGGEGEPRMAEEKGPSLQDRIQANARATLIQDRDRFAANISGKFVGPAADQLMARFDKFMQLFSYCKESAGTTSNYATDWLDKMHQALTTTRKGNGTFAKPDVVKPWNNNLESIVLSQEEMDEMNDVVKGDDAYTLDEAIEILQKWTASDVYVPDTDADAFDMEKDKAVFNMDVALSFKDPKLTKKVLEGAKKFETQLRAEAKARNFDKQRTQMYVDNGMKYFKGDTTFNLKLGELWSVDHQRLENPANKEEFEKEMRNIRMWF